MTNLLIRPDFAGLIWPFMFSLISMDQSGPDQSGSSLVSLGQPRPGWTSVWTILDLSLHQSGPQCGPVWTPVRTSLDLSMDQCGPQYGPVWTLNLDQSGHVYGPD